MSPKWHFIQRPVMLKFRHVEIFAIISDGWRNNLSTTNGQEIIAMGHSRYSQPFDILAERMKREGGGGRAS